MKARTLKKKVSTKQAKKNWSHSQNNRNVLSFFFFPFFFIASRRKAARMDSVERKKKEHCAPITMLPQILTKSNRL